MLRPILGGIISFIAVFITLSFLLPSATCQDGWKSGSIGRSGACSYHGGVDRSMSGMRFWLSLGVAIAAGFYIRRQDRPSTSRNPASEAPRSSCPNCRGPIYMYEKDGTPFSECSNSACRWTADGPR